MTETWRRPMRAEINDMITNFGGGNPLLANLPRKINIALSPSRDDFPHTHINDVGLVAVRHPETGEVLSCCSHEKSFSDRAAHSLQLCCTRW